MTPSSKRRQYIPFIIIAILCVILALRECSRSVVKESDTAPFDRDSAMKVVRAEMEELAMLHHISKIAEKPAIQYRDRWHTYKHDTVGVPYIQIINTCDSALSKDTDYENSLCNELGPAYKVISSQSVVIVGDSVNYGIELKKEKRRKNFWKVMTGIVAAANAVPR